MLQLHHTQEFLTSLSPTYLPDVHLTTLDGEGRVVSGHKHILATVSSKLESLFLRSEVVGPVMVRNIGFRELERVVDFIYSGNLIVETEQDKEYVWDGLYMLRMVDYDDVTPNYYEPAGFHPTELVEHQVAGGTEKVKVGEVTTSHHVVKFKVQAVGRQQTNSQQPVEVPVDVSNSQQPVVVPVDLSNSQKPVVVPVDISNSQKPVEVPVDLSNSLKPVEVAIDLSKSQKSVVVPVDLSNSQKPVEMLIDLSNSLKPVEVPVDLSNSQKPVVVPVDLPYSQQPVVVPVDLSNSQKPVELTTPKRETRRLTISKGRTNTLTSLKCGTRQLTTPKSVTTSPTKGDENDPFEAAHAGHVTNMTTTTPESPTIYDWTGDETENCEVTPEDVKSCDTNKKEELPTDQHKITTPKEQGGEYTEIIHRAGGHIGGGDIVNNVCILEESLLKEPNLKDKFPVGESEKGHSEQNEIMSRTVLLPPHKKSKKTMLCWKCEKVIRNSRHADKRHEFNCPARFCGLFFVTAEELAMHRLREHNKGQSGHCQGQAGEQHEQLGKGKQFENVPPIEEQQLRESCFYVLTEEPEMNVGQPDRRVNIIDSSPGFSGWPTPPQSVRCGSQTLVPLSAEVNPDLADNAWKVLVDRDAVDVQYQEGISGQQPVIEENIKIKQSTPPIQKDTFAGSNYPSCRRRHCGNCSGCLKEDCGSCRSCRNMCKYGGQGRSKQACLRRYCVRFHPIRLALRSPAEGDKGDKNNNDVKHALMLEARRKHFSPPTARPTRDVRGGGLVTWRTC